MKKTTQKKERKGMKIALLTILLLAMIVNLLLAVYIQLQKERNYEIIPVELRGLCFEDAEGGAGCGAVQTSVYAATFGISNPLIGYLGFASLAIMLLLLIYATIRQPLWEPGISVILAGGMLLAAIFSIWLLYVQFFLIHMLCIYCLWVDGIMIVSAAIFIWLQRKSINLKRF